MNNRSLIRKEINNDKSIVNFVAFELLKDVKEENRTRENVSDESLQILHSIFGDTLIRATELLENCKVFVYHLKDFNRKLIKLTGRKEHHVLFCHINFCRCNLFKTGILEGTVIVCEHILAIKLAEICGNIQTVLTTDIQMKDLLDDELKCLIEG